MGSDAYEQLLALGTRNTESSRSTAQAVLAQKKAREAEQRRKREESERKERALEEEMRKRHFQKLKEEQEAEARKAEREKAREADRERREAEQRDILRYGPKQAKQSGSKWPSSSSGVREQVRKKRLPSDEEDDDAGGSVLTRQEKRERKLQAELKRAFHAPRRPVGYGGGGGTRKAGRKLPGGAYDIATSDVTASASGSGNVRDRLSAMPNTLTRLNVNKRDTRTIDEIVRDMRSGGAKSETLNGESARTFDDWFTPAQRSNKATPAASTGPSRPSSLPPPSSSAVSGGKRATTTASPGPTGAPKPKPRLSNSQGSSTLKKRSISQSDSRSASPAPKRANVASASGSSSKSGSKPSRPAVPSSSSSKPKSRLPRSPGEGDSSAIGDVIWEMFGKKRSSYVANDVYSDSENGSDDMEADAMALEREEMASARLGRKEDRALEEEERRRMEEKRRRMER
ncbi:unnamed protein product [Mycena citricolor]|uniref:SPT2-domain-containing protein n=1 Tax=Mycena citricolor TaxID=2018698 RepID=A0AAD2H6R2_9AGAR|nr:unnamed protein product [Mycena citricolor]